MQRMQRFCCPVLLSMARRPGRRIFVFAVYCKWGLHRSQAMARAIAEGLRGRHNIWILNFGLVMRKFAKNLRALVEESKVIGGRSSLGAVPGAGWSFEIVIHKR